MKKSDFWFFQNFLLMLSTFNGITCLAPYFHPLSALSIVFKKSDSQRTVPSFLLLVCTIADHSFTKGAEISFH
jgi:hypothetical protein